MCWHPFLGYPAHHISRKASRDNLWMNNTVGQDRARLSKMAASLGRDAEGSTHSHLHTLRVSTSFDVPPWAPALPHPCSCHVTPHCSQKHCMKNPLKHPTISTTISFLKKDEKLFVFHTIFSMIVKELGT